MSNSRDDDDDLSIGFELTDRSLQARAKSRALSAFDRLIGNAADFFNVSLEARKAKKAALAASEVALIQAATEIKAKALLSEPALIERALEGTFAQSARRQENKDAVVQRTIEKLEAASPSVGADSGPPELSDDFLNAFERHAEDASNDDLREKWASVLSSEVLNPGTFSKKTMRIIDEISGEIARDFSEMISFRIGDSIPTCLFEPSFSLSNSLIEYDLINSTHPNTLRVGQNAEFNNGVRRLIVPFSSGAVVFKDQEGLFETIKALPEKKAVSVEYNKKVPAIPVALLTQTGLTIARLMPDLSSENMVKLTEKIRAQGIDNHYMEIKDGAFRYVNPVPAWAIKH